MSLTKFLGGLVLGVIIGAWNGRDLGATVARYSGDNPRTGLMSGLVKRTLTLSLALVISLKFGPHAWIGVAGGYLAGFAFMIRRVVKTRVS